MARRVETGVIALVLCAGCGAGNSSSSASAEGTADTGPNETTTLTAGETTTTASSADTTTTANPTTDDGPLSADGGPKLDVGFLPDVGEPNCAGDKGGGGDEPDFSYLWAANSGQGTITKIDTQTVTELGRYIVRPDSNGSPSRTSVSLSGDVAVANRSGGVTKIYATVEDCQESNGQPGIQTSEDATFLPWGEEECIAWHTPFAYASQRPVAWTPGKWSDATCSWYDEKLWTSGTNQSTDVLLLDGETGAVIDQVTLQGYPQDFYGIYGGASDAEGNFWGTKLSGVMLVRVDIDDLEVQMWPVPTGSYGMTVDTDGYVWACGSQFSRFDPENETWMQAAGGGYSGCMAAAGEDGLLWMAQGSQIIGADRHTLAIVQTLNVPDSYGISVDYYGYVWGVNGSGAHRVDPATGIVTSYNGLVGAYTYSDMTGYALANAGGGTPSG